MNMLLDTHAFLWFLFAHEKLSPKAQAVLSDRRNIKTISMASLWEIAIKVSIGKLRLGMDYGRFQSELVESREMEILDLKLPHLAAYARLPLHHRDPFDRILIAQAMEEDLPVVTNDANFLAYPIKTIW